MFKNRLVVLWIIASSLLLLYSFTQIDLNLTFSKASIFQNIQKFFIYIGYYQRSISTSLYIAIIALMFVLYFFTLHLSFTKKITTKKVWTIIFSVSAILFLSYNAFSYDLFNYIFDAKIVTNYHLNPYEHAPFEFIGKDPMLHFMRSTDRFFPYGPIWLGISLIPSFFGLQIFLITLYLFKAVMVLTFLMCGYFLGKIMEILSPEEKISSLIFVMLNPLLIIESLVSSHNDIVMIAFMMGALYFILQKKHILGLLFFIISVGIKFATIVLLPVILYIIYCNIKNKKINKKIVAFISLISMIGAFFRIAGPTAAKGAEIQPWYYINVIPFAGFVMNFFIVRLIIYAVSIGSLLYYVPLLLYGEWPKNIVEIKNIIFAVSIIIAFFMFLLYRKKGTI